LSISISAEGSFAWNCCEKTKHYYMGEVEETDGLIDNDKTQRYQSINTACDDAV